MNRRDPIPSFPIGPVLEYLGMEIVPAGIGWVRCRCFRHEDNTASASVNHEKNGFTCHSCEVSGDSLKLLQTELGLTFREALEKAREITGMTTEPPRRKRRASEILGRVA